MLNNIDSGFEESENDMTDEEGHAHDVHVGINSEMDINNLNSDVLRGCPLMRVDDEDQNNEADEFHSSTEFDLDIDQNRISKCHEFNFESNSLNPQLKGMD
ncbi:hypothetical protein V6N13_036139 [Hibiscus sabdariffa]